MTTLFKLEHYIRLLEKCPKDGWATLYVELKRKFFKEHQMGFIFSTRFGADFFIECRNWILKNGFLKDEVKELGVYDKNFDAWLKTVRTEK